MPLVSGQVTTVERVGSVSLPEESSTWVALYRGGGGAGRGGGRGGRGGGRAGGPPVPPPSTPAANTPSANPAPAPAVQGTTPAGRGTQAQGAEPEAREGSTSSRTRRKESGSDPILRNLVSGQETTLPLVSDFKWNRDGSWIAYGMSSPKAEEDGAFARQMGDGSVRTLLEGKGNYKAFGFDEDGKQLAFLSDQAEDQKDVAPYRVYYWKPSDATASELVAATTRGLPSGLVVSDQGTLSFSSTVYGSIWARRRRPLHLRRKARPSRAAWTCGTGRIAAAADAARAHGGPQSLPRGRASADKQFGQLATPEMRAHPG